MAFNPSNPLVVQSDKTILLEANNDLYPEARDALARFAELEKSPEYIHTYRITPLSLWNAAAAGMTAKGIIDSLLRFSRYEVPQNVIADVEDNVARYGRLKLFKDEKGRLVLHSDDALLIMELLNQRGLQPLITGSPDANHIFVKPGDRGNVKCALIKIGYPVEDLAGYVQGAPLPLELRTKALSGLPFSLRKYQVESVDAFHMRGSNHGGSGVVVLPCGRR